MTTARRLADDYLDDLCRLDPIFGSYVGDVDARTRLPDFSPEGAGERAHAARLALTALASASRDTVEDESAALLLQDRLSITLDQFEAGSHLRALSVIGSPVGTIRAAFDNMPIATDQDWEAVIERLEAVPTAYASLRRSYEHGLDRGVVAAARQANACAEQAEQWAGMHGATPWFESFASKGPDALRVRLDRAARAATASVGELGAYLRQVYAPAVAHVPDAAGAERYELGVRQFLGAELDIDEAYEWAWHELARIEDEMRRRRREIVPGASIAEAMAHLDAEGEAVEAPTPCATGSSN
ncbi:MAG: DUF885 family protein [Ilumatobacteraceae bacterium]